MKKYLLVALIGLSFLGAGFRAAAQSILKGNITDLKADTLSLYYRFEGENKSAKVPVKAGTFAWSAPIKEPSFSALYLPVKGVMEKFSFYLAPGVQTLTGSVATKEEFKKLSLKGNSEQEDYLKFSKHSDSLLVEYSKLNDSAARAVGEAKVTMQGQADKMLRVATFGAAEDYIQSHPDKYLSVDMLVSILPNLDPSKARELYDGLTPFLKGSSSGKLMAGYLKAASHGELGNYIAEFVLNDVDGKSVKFSEFKGKYVLIDFWASWCAPCRAENPNVLKLYKEFKDKNFTVLGISLDTKTEDWKKAIKEDGLPWTQLLDKRGKDSLSGYYGITGIPSNFLVDPEGKIVGRNLRGDTLGAKLKELLE
ncbi:AhpC/TSA family protein [Pedobacter sp. ISL-68]|uniref:AhpC/TSA family protein n=1 Tax=unclassified Pedobacter TaxID=2628915 RepID=UPI001BE8991C|nr:MULTISPECIES: AhpC/TSA family protein [unclassified Pedobacter]MBT2560200.1 AhpC/TSA family protein [Pedobacter sp. ISL-64]MBT2589179.1 AhpC/TSA family protein [Pedobacter sp. ISL-68]